MEIIHCPECDAPAEVVSWDDPFDPGAPEGYVVVRCVDRHWFLALRDLFPAEQTVQGISRESQRP